MTEIKDSPRFRACTEFVATEYGNGYTELTVTDTLTGLTESTGIYGVEEKAEAAQRLAKKLVAMSAPRSDDKGWSFNLDNDSPIDGPEYDA